MDLWPTNSFCKGNSTYNTHCTPIFMSQGKSETWEYQDFKWKFQKDTASAWAARFQGSLLTQPDTADGPEKTTSYCCSELSMKLVSSLCNSLHLIECMAAWNIRFWVQRKWADIQILLLDCQLCKSPAGIQHQDSCCIRGSHSALNTHVHTHI